MLEEARSALTAQLAAVVRELNRLEPGDWSASTAEAHLRALAEPLRGLQAHRSIVMAAAVERQVGALPEPRQDRARRRLERHLGEAQGLTSGESHRVGAAGRTAESSPEAGRAFRSGALSERHIEQLGRTLARVPEQRRDAVERELLALATRLDAASFGREARAIEKREAPRDAARRAQFEHARRFLHVTGRDDGGVSLRGQLSGLAAEQLRVGLDAFRHHLGADDRRNGEQRAADALVAMAQAALRAGDGATNRNIRPQVIVLAEAARLQQPDGFGRFAHSREPVSWSELGGLLGDCALTAVLRDATGAPIAVSEAVRTVPVGLMKALIARDGGCAWTGCGRPWTQCQVAHGVEAYRDGGRLRVEDAALLCDEHHRALDGGWWDVVIDGAEVSFHRRAVRREVPAAWDAMLGLDGDAAGALPRSRRTEVTLRIEPRALDDAHGRSRRGVSMGQEAQRSPGSPPDLSMRYRSAPSCAAARDGRGRAGDLDRSSDRRSLGRTGRDPGDRVGDAARDQGTRPESRTPLSFARWEVSQSRPLMARHRQARIRWLATAPRFGSCRQRGPPPTMIPWSGLGVCSLLPAKLVGFAEAAPDVVGESCEDRTTSQT